MTAIATTKAYRGLGMEGSVARWYDKITRKDMEQFRGLANRLRGWLPQGGDVLEVAPGPGFLSIELGRDRRFRVTGLDISKTFVELANRNASAAEVCAEFRHGNAAKMPFSDNSFDLLVCRAAFKNFAEPRKALEEMYRVLRPGASGLIIDLRRDVPMDEVKRHFHSWGLNAWNRWLTTQTFRFMLLKRAYTLEEFEQLILGIGFREAEVRTADIGLEVWLRK